MSRKAKPYDWDWHKVSRIYLRNHPICAVAGCGQKATTVDHIVTVKAAPERRMDPLNWQALCHACHNRLTKAYDSGRLAGACDEDGQPLDPGHPWAQDDNASAIAVANDRPKASPIVAASLKRMAVRRFMRRGRSP